VEFSIQFILGFNFDEFGVGVAKERVVAPISCGSHSLGLYSTLGLLDETAFPLYTRAKVTLIE
jgi:hypothetical protein